MQRKQTPFVVVGSLKIYEKLHDLGWYGRRLCGDFPTVFLYEVGACADPGIFARGGGGRGSRPDCQKTALTTFLVLNFTEGVQPTVISNKTIIFNIFRGGGGGGPNANFYRNPYNL